MTNSHNQSDNQIVFTSEEKLYLESKHDILLLLEHLAQSQETTVKLILSRLYDIGTDNLINQKISYPHFQKLFKGVTKIPKSAFIIVAFYWFKKNCPQLITDWLLEQISVTQKEETTQEIVTVNSNSVEAKQLKIKQLDSQVQVLTRVVIVLVGILGSGITWVFYNTNTIPLSDLPNNIPTINR